MNIRLWLFLGLCFELIACGYRFSGGGSLPGGIRKVCIPIFENRTAQTGIETQITNDFIDEFNRNGKEIVPSEQMADAVLEGRIANLRYETISRKGLHLAFERRVYLQLEFKLKDASGKVLWSGNDVASSEAYSVLDNKFTTEENRRNAISTISKRLAETVYYQLTWEF